MQMGMTASSTLTDVGPIDILAVEQKSKSFVVAEQHPLGDIRISSAGVSAFVAFD